MLIAARALQGVGGALLVPGSLAIIESSFAPCDRGRAIGAWSGLGGIAAAIGPFIGGWLVSAVSWRLIFLLNLPLAVVVLAASRHVPESTDPQAVRQIDVAGAGLVVIGLASDDLRPHRGTGRREWRGGRGGRRRRECWRSAAFVLVERRSSHPMLPLGIFASRQFTAANLVTFVVYAALGGRPVPAGRRSAAGVALFARGRGGGAVPRDGDHVAVVGPGRGAGAADRPPHAHDRRAAGRHRGLAVDAPDQPWWPLRGRVCCPRWWCSAWGWR